MKKRSISWRNLRKVFFSSCRLPHLQLFLLLFAIICFSIREPGPSWNLLSDWFSHPTCPKKRGGHVKSETRTSLPFVPKLFPVVPDHFISTFTSFPKHTPLSRPPSSLRQRHCDCCKSPWLAFSEPDPGLICNQKSAGKGDGSVGRRWASRLAAQSRKRRWITPRRDDAPWACFLISGAIGVGSYRGVVRDVSSMKTCRRLLERGLTADWTGKPFRTENVKWFYSILIPGCTQTPISHSPK